MATLETVIAAGLFADRPAPGVPGRLYCALDQNTIYRDNGLSWDRVGGALGAPSQMVLNTQPASTTAGTVLVPAPVVLVLDGSGNFVPAPVDITVALWHGGAPVAGLGGTATVSAGAGIAVFSDLAVSIALTNYALQFTATDLIPVSSSSFDIS